MDKALDEVIGERQTGRDDFNRIDDDWLHDKYDDDDDPRAPPRYSRPRRVRDRDSPDADLVNQTAKLRVENLHYDLTEDDLEELFNRVAPVTSLTLTYDRAGRSTGTAYVTYRSVASARAAVREFDGANAHGQPIRLALVPAGPAARRNPFDSAAAPRPGRSLFDRIGPPGDAGRNGGGGGGGGSRGRRGRSVELRARSRSPPPRRRANVRRPPPDGVDRYVPGGADDSGDGERLARRARSRSPPPRRREGSRGRRGRRGGAAEARRDEEGRPLVGGRPRMTQAELDRDMDAYWGSNADANGAPAAAAPTDAGLGEMPAAAAPNVAADGDIDMAE